MKSRDGIFGELIRGKTPPGSVVARTQYSQMRLMLAAQWIFIPFIVGALIYCSLWWGVLVIAFTSFFGIPAERKFLTYLRDNAYPDGSPEERLDRHTNTATIHVHRPERVFSDRFRSRTVVIDRETVGLIRRGETATFEVPAGRHEVFTKIDWCRSPAVDLNLNAGEEVWLSSRSRSPLLGIYWITLGRRRYSILEVVDGPPAGGSTGSGHRPMGGLPG